MLRRALHVATVAIAILAGLSAAAIAGAWLWLRTDGGQRVILEHIRAPLRAAGVELDAEHITGTLISSLRLNGVTARLCAQRISVQARSVAVEYRILSLLRSAPDVALTVDQPVVRQNAVPCSLPAGDPPALPKRIVLRRLEIRDGVVGSALTQIELVGEGRVERDSAGGPAFSFDLAKASARIFTEPSDGRLELSGHVTADTVDLELTASVARDDLARHAAGAVDAGPISAELHAVGPPDALRIEGHAKTALGDADVSGTVDAPGRRAEIILVSRRLAIAPPGSDVEIGASAELRVIAAPDAKGALRMTVRGHGDYTRRGFDPSLAGASMKRHLEDLPGGTWSGSAEATADGDALSARFHVNLSSQGKREAAPANVVLSGKLVMPRAGRPRLEASITPREAATP